MADPIRAALERLVDAVAGHRWDAKELQDAIAALRATLAAHPAMDGPAVPQGGREGEATMAEDALIALERIARGDASHGSDDLDLIAVALGQLRRYGAAPPPVEEERGGPSVAEIDAAYLATWCEESGRYDIVAFARAILSRWGRPAAAAPAPVEGEAVPEGREPAAVAPEASDWFKVALIAQDMRSRGLAEQAAGDELLKLANERRTPPVPAPPPAPAEGEVGELEEWLWNEAFDHDADHTPEVSLRLLRIRELLLYHLQAQATELATLRAGVVPVPSGERLPEAADCAPWPDEPDASPWCWVGSEVDGAWAWEQRSDGCLVSFPGDFTHWLPHWAIPLPQPPQGGEVEG